MISSTLQIIPEQSPQLVLTFGHFRLNSKISPGNCFPSNLDDQLIQQRFSHKLYAHQNKCQNSTIPMITCWFFLNFLKILPSFSCYHTCCCCCLPLLLKVNCVTFSQMVFLGECFELKKLPFQKSGEKNLQKRGKQNLQKSGKILLKSLCESLSCPSIC